MIVKGCVNIQGEDLVVEGEVWLPRVIGTPHARDATDFDIKRAYTDDQEQKHEERCIADWTDAEFELAEDALFEAAVDEVKKARDL